MKKDWLGKKLSEDLSDYPSTADFEQLWGGIEERRRPEKDRRRGLLWLFFLLVAGGAIVAIWHLEKEDKTSLEENQPLVLEKTKDHQNASASIADSKELHSQVNAVEEKGDIVSSAITKPSVNSQEKTKPADPLFSSTKTRQSTQSKITESLLPADSTLNAVSLVDAAKDDLTTSSSIPIFSKTSIPKDVKQTTYSIIPSIPIHSFSATKWTDSLADHPYSITPCSLTRSPSLWLRVGVAYGHFTKKRTVFDPEQIDYARRFGEAEKALDIKQVEISLKKYLSPQWYLQGGIGYALLTSKFYAVSTSTYTKTLSDQLIKTIYYPDGSFEEVRGELEIPVEQMRIRTVYNRTHLLHVPVLTGWEWPLARKWRLGLATGLHYNYLLNVNGVNYASNTSLGTYENLKTSDYDNRHLFQWSGQVEVRYQLNKQLSGYLGLRINRALNQLEHSRIGATEKWHISTLGLGLEIGL